MSLLIAIIVGIAVGAGGGFLLREGIDHLILNVIVGIAGSLAGLVIYVLVLRQSVNTPLFDPAGIVSSLIGALIFVLGFNGLHKVVPEQASHAEEADTEELDRS